MMDELIDMLSRIRYDEPGNGIDIGQAFRNYANELGLAVHALSDEQKRQAIINSALVLLEEIDPVTEKYTTVTLYNNAGTVTVPAYRPSLYSMLCDLWNQQGIRIEVGE